MRWTGCNINACMYVCIDKNFKCIVVLSLSVCVRVCKWFKVNHAVIQDTTLQYCTHRAYMHVCMYVHVTFIDFHIVRSVNVHGTVRVDGHTHLTDVRVDFTIFKSANIIEITIMSYIIYTHRGTQHPI